MLFKLCKNSSVKSILVVSLSNIGDVVLTCPVIDCLLRDFPNATISVIVGPKATSLFANHPRIKTILFDKQQPWAQWFLKLRPKSYSVLIDLRQSGLGLFLPCHFSTPLIPKPFAGHMRLKHLQRLKTVYPGFVVPQEHLAIVPKPLGQLMHTPGYVVIAPGAANRNKRWNEEGFTAVAEALAAQGRKIVFVGDQNDEPLVRGIQAKMRSPSLSLAGKIDLRELAFVLQNAKFALTHDSGVMHMACYFDVSLVVLWGPTDRDKYGPWSKNAVTVFRGVDMSSIAVKDVLNAIAQL